MLSRTHVIVIALLICALLGAYYFMHESYKAAEKTQAPKATTAPKTHDAPVTPSPARVNTPRPNVVTQMVETKQKDGTYQPVAVTKLVKR